MTAAHASVGLLLAIASVAWVFVTKNPRVSSWGFVLVVALLIIIAYLILVAVSYFFGRDFKIAHHWDLHLTLLAVVTMIVTVPLAMMQSYTNAQTRELIAQKQEADEKLKGNELAQEMANEDRRTLYKKVAASLKHILQKNEMHPEDLNNLLHYCIESISVNNPRVQASDLRTTVVFLHGGGRYLLVPPQGYFGKNLYEEIGRLYFDVSPQKVSEGEDTETYLSRLGVAGWCFANRSPVLDNDVLNPGKTYRYKHFQPDPDHAMICVLIPDLSTPNLDRYVGVLSISSLTPGVLTANDQALAEFFATLLGRFRFLTPLELPQFIRDEEKATGPSTRH